MMTVHYSDLAVEDLVQVWSDVYCASGDLETADRYTTDIQEKIEKKSSFPFSGVPVLFYGFDIGIKMIPFKAYLIFYKVKGQVMEIGRILPARSDYMHLLLEGDDGTLLMER